MRAKDVPIERKRILLVDDHADILEILTIASATNFMFPVMRLQCLAAIRARSGYNDIPAVALTALAHDSERNRMLAAGFQSVVVKPLYDERELRKVETAVRDSKITHPVRTP